MILSKKLSEAFNAQVNAEMWSSNLYLSMSVHFQKLGLNGFAHWMKKQAEEEMEHAHKMIDFTIDRGGDITIGQINVVPTAWGSVTELFEHVYKHECYVSELIDKMVDIAEEDKDHASRDFLFGFVREQVEEESTAKEIVEQLKNYGECHVGILDHSINKKLHKEPPFLLKIQSDNCLIHLIVNCQLPQVSLSPTALPKQKPLSG